MKNKCPISVVLIAYGTFCGFAELVDDYWSGMHR